MKGILIVMMALVTGCGNPTETTSNVEQQTQQVEIEEQVAEQNSPIYEVLSVTDFKTKIENLAQYTLLDVRTADEVAGGTINNALNLDYYAPNFKEELAKLRTDKPLLIFCRSGNRSGKASKIAQEVGFTEIYDLKGGYMAWSAQ